MSLQLLQQPIIYLLTGGATKAQMTPASEEFAAILKLVAAAVAAKVSLIQLREKQLSARVLYELTTRAAQLTRESQTQLLVNDRADIARAAGADGVHLTSSSLRPSVIRQIFGPDFLIGVSTHSEEEVCAGRDDGGDFAVWGPVFATNSKLTYGKPQGVNELASIARQLRPFPVIPLGGINMDNVDECFNAGASGIAGITVFQDQKNLSQVVSHIREVFAKSGKRKI